MWHVFSPNSSSAETPYPLSLSSQKQLPELDQLILNSDASIIILKYNYKKNGSNTSNMCLESPKNWEILGLYWENISQEEYCVFTRD